MLRIVPLLRKGQLEMIEFKFFMFGLLGGLITGFVLVYLGSTKVIPFQIPVICGLIGNNPKYFLFGKSSGKGGQLVGIEFHYALIGFVIGIIGSFVLVYLGNAGIIPFQIPVCPPPTPAK